MAAVQKRETGPMPLDTPILKVSRPVAACTRCRNAKIKCDGKLPACSSCEKNGRAEECKNTNEEFAKGKERSYVATLETKIERLEARLEEARKRKPSVVDAIPIEDSKDVSRRASVQVQEGLASTNPKLQRQRETTAIDDLVSDFGFLSVNATTRDFYGFTQTMSYARLILWSCEKEPLSEETYQAYPPRQLANQLIQQYLDNVLALLPLFQEASFYGSVDSVYSPNRNAGNAVDHFMVRMVLAIASAMCSQQRGDQMYHDAVGHVCEATRLAEKVLHPGSITSIQALLLLVQYAMLDPHRFDSWNLVGAASRASVDLGLHQDPMKGTQMSRAKLETRRKVFYCVYALDRSTSLIQSRAFSFSDDSVKVKIPYLKPQSAPSTPQGNDASTGMPPSWLHTRDRALEFITMRKIQSKWYNDLFQSGRSRWEEPYPYIWNACLEMRNWFDSISSSTPPHMKVFFELDLLYSYVYLLSPSPRVPVTAHYAQTLVFEHCVRYSSLMMAVIQERNKFGASLSFYDAMRVYMTGRQFADVLNTSLDMLLNGRLDSPPQVKSGSAPAPPLPSVALPAGEAVLRFNIRRSIACIQEFAECLSHFGTRFGYMSWTSRFENETAPILVALEKRQTYLEEMSGPSSTARRTSPYQHHTPSLNQSNSTNFSMRGSQYTGNSVSTQSVQGDYQQHAPACVPQYSPPVTSTGLQPQIYQDNNQVVGFHNQAPAVQQPFQVLHPQQQQQQQQQTQFPQYTAPDPCGDVLSSFPQNFDFNSRPSVQFANWSGYAGAPTTLASTANNDYAPDARWDGHD